MSREQIRCKGCGRFRVAGRFDASFATADGREVHGFGLRGRYCPRCRSLALDPESLLLLGLGDASCISAIASDARPVIKPTWAA